MVLVGMDERAVRAGSGERKPMWSLVPRYLSQDGLIPVIYPCQDQLKSWLKFKGDLAQGQHLYPTCREEHELEASLGYVIRFSLK